MTAEKTSRIAIVTGASRGIGASIAERLGSEGYSLVLTARTAESLEDVSARLRQRGVECVPVVADLGAEASAQHIVDMAIGSFGRIDVVVANAGAARHGNLLDQSDADWFDGFSVKLFGHVRLIRAAWNALEAAKGCVVMIGGVAGRTPVGEYPIGSTVNAAVLALTKSLADFGRSRGVRVNAVNPGQIRTARLAERLGKLARSQDISLPAAERLIVEKSNGMRIGDPSDIADAVAFLANPGSRHLQGAIIDVDGGMTKGL
jgi:3-oxoacyl-[acyl-carrier protein] reductase